MEKNKRNKTIILVSIITAILLLVVGITYAYSNLITGTTQKLVLGDIYMHYKESNTLTLSNAMPSSTYDNSKYFEFTIDGKNTYQNNDIYYEILLSHGDNHATRTTRIKDNLLKFTLVEINGNTETIVVDGKSFNEINNSKIWVNTIPKNTLSQVNITYRLYMWISDKTRICGGEATDCDYYIDRSDTSTDWNNTYASIKVNVNGDFEEKEVGTPLTDVFKEVLLSRPNSYILEDGIYYVSGAKDDNNPSTTDDIDFNYVWYSGKLWRITAINADGSLKLITQDNITSIAYGSDYNFYTDSSTSSWIYQWLNEDFLDTLYNYENIIETDSMWNVTSGDGTISTKLAETTMVPAKVGLLNSYEYYKSYQKSLYPNGYLNIGYDWWLLNRYSSSSSYVWYVRYDGNGNSNDVSDANGVRPSINLKSTIGINGGIGSKMDPYRIKDDKEDVVANTTLLNTRTSGEYVKIKNDAIEDRVFRIINTEVINGNLTTKLVLIDYVTQNGSVLTRKFSDNSVALWSNISETDETYCKGFLNTKWLSTFDTTKLEQGTYYLGTVNSSAANYKLAICASASNTISTKECTKTSTTYTGYVGLPRYGEMFSSQLGSGGSSSEDMWLITPNSSLNVWHVDSDGFNSPDGVSIAYGVRPSINLKSNIVITGGSGTENNPFLIQMDTYTLPYAFSQPYISGAYTSGDSAGITAIGSATNYSITNSNIPDEVEYINVIDVYALHQQNYISGGTLSLSGTTLSTNYLNLIDINFCGNNPSICNTYEKEEFNYLADKWATGGSSITAQDAITLSYNISDKKLYITNGNANMTFYLAFQFVVGDSFSQWEHFTNYNPCLHGNTIVYVYDEKKKKFKKKKIKYVDYDDLLLVWDFDKGEFAVSKPVWVKMKETTNSYNLLTFSDGSTLKTINQHRIFNKEKGMFTLCMTDDTPIGTTTFNSKGEYVKLVSKEVIYKEVDFYNVWTDYHINLFTDNILTSCRFSNLYKIENMKYITEERDNSDYISKLNLKEKWVKGLRLNEQPIDINIDNSLKFNGVKEYIELLESLDIDNVVNKL